MNVNNADTNRNGFIKLWYGMKDWEWADDPHTLALWIHLLLAASWQDKEWKGHTIKRGQIVFGRKQWAEKTGLSEQQIRTCLTKLKSTSNITITSTSKFSLLTIVNYEKYQSSEKKQPANQPATRPVINQQVNHILRLEDCEEGKTSKKDPPIVPQGEKLLFPDPVVEKPPKVKKPRAMQMPQGWKPHDAHRAKCSSLGLNPEDLAEKFENYHASKGSLFVDWDRAFFTWIGNAKEFNQNHRGSNNENYRKPSNKAPTIDGETGEIINDQPSGNSFGNNPKRDQGMDKAQRIYAGAMHLYESKIRQ